MRSGARVGIVASLLTALSCAACTLVSDPPPARPAPPEPLSPSQFRDAALDIVERRDAALRGGDRDDFLSTVDDDALQFVATQARWFDNLAAMPVTDVRLAPVGRRATDAAPEDGELRMPVDFTMRLDGYEQRSVTQRLLYTFSEDEGVVALVNDRDAGRDRRAGWIPDPWDLDHVVVRESGSILALFDEDTALYADAVMLDLEASRETVLAAVPDWSGQLVAYDVSDLTGLERRTPMQVFETGGVAYPVPVRPGSDEVAAVRFIVNPDVAHNGLQREFLLRHEVAHVALGTKDAASPTWLVEGAAEYVSRTHYSAEQRRRMAAYVVARLGTAVPALANGVDFYAVPELSYELAAAACTYLAATRGPESLWDLMDAFTAERPRLGQAGPLTAAQVDAVLRREIGLDNAGLARAAAVWAVGGS
ncbi:hypothetical protein [Nocardioides piscis]|uniref:Peptidase MA-like domain-containing protein n=1 Tax=Nocardioides piscis TaxID=2714938 RepID=A0A6G7YJZ5_9ACTN|nr:hypothetical protein [Nocardioides piscis]QIK77071.1 hypothetical protein G7071_18155 [Nocardioides piscis]